MVSLKPSVRLTVFKADMKSLRTHDLSTVSTPDCDEDLILHKAAGIIPKHIGNVVIQSDAYPSPADTPLSQSQSENYANYFKNIHMLANRWRFL
ncbi:unnamed protein product [Mytilus coruscus]|uniref:Uncharacterized protein n=1 Tax=Mytilus coruscus TaxID=42192 RepID=A0A6J8AZH0_MYTCO|nr:unnamed protein product [Mytilus coruscus]